MLALLISAWLDLLKAQIMTSQNLFVAPLNI